MEASSGLTGLSHTGKHPTAETKAKLSEAAKRQHDKKG